MKVVREGDVRLFEAPAPYPRRARVLLDSATVGEELAASLGISYYAPGERADFHRHASDELMLVLEGTGYIEGEDGRHRLQPRCAIYVPAAEAHAVVNDGSSPLVFAFVYVPPGPEQKTKVQWRAVEEG